MFSNGRKAVAQVAHAAFQENVHFKFLHVEHFIEEIRQMSLSEVGRYGKVVGSAIDSIDLQVMF